MANKRIRPSFLYLLCLPFTLPGQTHREIAPLRNWPTPLHWQPSADEQSFAAKRAMLSGTSTAEAKPAQTPTNPLVFVGMTPCRLVDTRGNGFAGAFGPPSLTAGATRSFPLQASTTCSIPSSAQAYSLNITAIPPGFLGYVTIWPYGAPQPLASTLNDYLGTVVANAAIVPAGSDSSGSVDVYASHNTDLVIDINGYFTQDSAALGFAYIVQCGANVFGTNINCPGNGPLTPGTPTLILQTQAIPTTAFYLVSSSANISSSSSGGSYSECYITTTSDNPLTGFLSIGGPGFTTLSNTDAFGVNAGDSIQLWCSASPISGTSSFVIWASLSAVQMNYLNGEQYQNPHPVRRSVLRQK